MQIRWDYEASATANAQLAFFAEFLARAGVYECWVNRCPLSYTSGNASHKREVLGTWFLSILAGHHRYAAWESPIIYVTDIFPIEELAGAHPNRILSAFPHHR